MEFVCAPTQYKALPVSLGLTSAFTRFDIYIEHLAGSIIKSLNLLDALKSRRQQQYARLPYTSGCAGSLTSLLASGPSTRQSTLRHVYSSHPRVYSMQTQSRRANSLRRVKKRTLRRAQSQDSRTSFEMCQVCWRMRGKVWHGSALALVSADQLRFHVT